MNYRTAGKSSDFLHKPMKDWPQEYFRPDLKQVEKKVRKKQTIASMAAGKSVINCNAYSTWKKLIKINCTGFTA